MSSEDSSKQSSSSSSGSSAGSAGSQGSQSSQANTLPMDYNTDYQAELDDDDNNEEGEREMNWGLLTPVTDSYRAFDLSKDIDSFSFGRLPTSQYVFKKSEFKGEDVAQIYLNLSKEHFVIYKIEDDKSECGFTVYIKDSSSNGTFINGDLIGKGNTRPLKSGAKIAILKRENTAFIFTNVKLQEIEVASLPADFSKKYDLENVCLGEGATGIVRRAQVRNSSKKVAVKIIKKNRALSFVNDVAYEGHLMRQMSHKYIVKVEDVFETEKAVYIILEYVEGGELFDYVKTNGAIPENRCKVWFLQLLEALEHLHSKGITHRDLKPENILLSSRDTETCVLKITDFGLSRVVAEQSLLKTLVGTSLYLAPEIMGRRGYTRSVDLWSLGCILFIMLSGSPPFVQTENEEELSENICTGNYEFKEKLWKNVSQTAKTLVRELLTVDPTKRISLSKALRHDWFYPEHPPLKKQKIQE